MNACPSRAVDLDVKIIAPQEYVGGSESDTFIAIEEAVVVSERLHQGGRLFSNEIVIAGLRTKNRGLDSALIADTVETAEYID